VSSFASAARDPWLEAQRPSARMSAVTKRVRCMRASGKRGLRSEAAAYNTQVAAQGDLLDRGPLAGTQPRQQPGGRHRDGCPLAASAIGTHIASRQMRPGVFRAAAHHGRFLPDLNPGVAQARRGFFRQIFHRSARPERKGCTGCSASGRRETEAGASRHRQVGYRKLPRRSL